LLPSTATMQTFDIVHIWCLLWFNANSSKGILVKFWSFDQIPTLCTVIFSIFFCDVVSDTTLLNSTTWTLFFMLCFDVIFGNVISFITCTVFCLFFFWIVSYGHHKGILVKFWLLDQTPTKCKVVLFYCCI